MKKKHPDPDCELCEGTGIMSVPNGEDDFDEEECECVS